MVLELARRRALDRPVARVVDARGELVRQQAAADVEELEREDADVAELVEQLRRVLLRVGLRRSGRGRARRPQDPALVHVLDERIEARVPADAADGEQRQLAVERDAFLEDMVGV